MYNTSHMYNTYKFIPIYVNNCTDQVSEYKYIPILAIHTNNNTYQYIQEYIPCQYIPIDASQCGTGL